MSQRTLIDKVWDAHVIRETPDGRALLHIDRHFVHEGSHHAFDRLAEKGLKVARPDLTFGVADHYVPTRGREEGIANPAIRRMVDQLSANTERHGIRLFGLGDRRQGIVHVVGPEQGLTLPGLMIVCGDSHTSTHGALGAFAFGIGASEVAHVLATQTLWQRRPKRMRVTVSGRLGPGIAAKDLALALIARIGADGAAGHAIEYAGEAVRALSVEARLTLSNMAIEAGARCAMTAPDETTLAYIEGRPFAPRDRDLEKARKVWLGLASDKGASFDREVEIPGGEVAPTVTWGTSPEQALPIDAAVPDPDGMANPAKAEAARQALAYMGLAPGQKLSDIAVNRVFIGSCTNARIEDLRLAAAVLAGRKAAVPGFISPGSMLVKQQAEQEGLAEIFRQAGLDWVEAGCSACVGMNGDIVPPGERCASTTNRNFQGRQGPGARTHIMSPAMVAASAVTGRLTDPRPLLEGRLS